MATVVTKLFAIAQADRGYFGQKDAQQLMVLRRLAEDLHIPIEVIGCPIVREADGLALSSRNVYLSPGERRQALSLSRGLRAAGWLDDAQLAAIEAVIAREIAAAVEFAEAGTLEPVADLTTDVYTRVAAS